ncbi:MAG: hypothetical protein JWQ76_4542 [Ramlibacter sp.]|nr:hypothetical protein [Ramlibacter sp.]
MADPKKVYWDACAWIALIKDEPGRAECCRYVVDQARTGNLQIWTSAFTLAEVFKKTVGGNPLKLPETKDLEFEQYIEQEFVVVAQVDFDIGVLARRLLRMHAKLRKPADAIHLATAVLYNLDEFHTYDEVNLLILNHSVKRRDGKPLTICTPPVNPMPGLFEKLAEEVVATDTTPPVPPASPEHPTA